MRSANARRRARTSGGERRPAATTTVSHTSASSLNPPHPLVELRFALDADRGPGDLTAALDVRDRRADDHGVLVGDGPVVVVADGQTGAEPERVGRVRAHGDHPELHV